MSPRTLASESVQVTRCHVLRVSHYFDGVHERRASGRYITVREGLITQISDHIPQDARQCAHVDLSHFTVTPGLIDMHQHLLLTDRGFASDFFREVLRSAKLNRESRLAQARGHAHSLLISGFTSVRDLGNSGKYLDHELGDFLAVHQDMGPRFFYSGPGIAVNKGQFAGGASERWVKQEYSIISSSEQAQLIVAEHLKNGVHWIKVYADNDPGEGVMPPEMLAAIVQSAHAAGLKVTAHATRIDSAINAAQAGVDSIEHGFKLNERALSLMKEKNTTLVPTDFDYEECLILSQHGTGADFRDCGRYRDAMATRLLAARKAGVPIVFGSDMYVHLVSPLEERGPATLGALMAYVEEGLSMGEALRAATAQAARLLGASDLGMIQVGMKADIVAFRGDPFKTANDLKNVNFVMKDGEVIMSDTRLVYSTDPKLNQKCSKCKELLSECTCPEEVDPTKYKFIAVLRIEKQGRGGKTVTVIDRLPKNELFLKNLTTQLKKKCGSGGTYLMEGRDGVIEIQGDKREIIRTALLKEGIQSKG